MVCASAAGLALWAGGVAVAVSFYGALLYLGVRGARKVLGLARRLQADQRERMRAAADQRRREHPRPYDFAALAGELAQRGPGRPAVYDFAALAGEPAQRERGRPAVYDFAALAAERSRRRQARVVDRERRRAA